MNKRSVLAILLTVAVIGLILYIPTAQASFLQRLADRHEEHQCSLFGVNCDETSSSNGPTPTYNTTYNTDNNQPPVWTNNQTLFYVTAGELLNFPMGAYDPENQAVTLRASYLPLGAIYNDFLQTFSWTPANYQTGTYTVQFSAFDGRLYSYKTVNIVVQPDQQAPTAPVNPITYNNKPQFVNFNPSGTGKVNQFYSYDVNAVDADNDRLTYSLTTKPSGMLIDSNTGLITWFPIAGQTGFQFVQVSVSDGQAQTTQGFYIFVDGATVAITPTPLPPITPGPSVPQNPAEAKITFSDIKFEIADGEIYVNWKTNIPSGSRVIWDTASQAEKTSNFTYDNATADNRDLVTNHRVLIGKLDTGTVHYLRLVSKTDRQTGVSQEIAFVELGEGRIASIFGANLIDLFGDLFGNTTFLWLLIIGLGVFSFLMYRKTRSGSPL